MPGTWRGAYGGIAHPRRATSSGPNLDHLGALCERSRPVAVQPAWTRELSVRRTGTESGAKAVGPARSSIESDDEAGEECIAAADRIPAHLGERASQFLTLRRDEHGPFGAAGDDGRMTVAADPPA